MPWRIVHVTHLIHSIWFFWKTTIRWKIIHVTHSLQLERNMHAYGLSSIALFLVWVCTDFFFRFDFPLTLYSNTKLYLETFVTILTNELMTDK